MTRQDLYRKVKELNLQEFIKNECGANYTNVPNTVLYDIISKATAPKKKVVITIKKPRMPKNSVQAETRFEGDNCKEAIVALLSILQAKRVVTANEANTVASLL